MDRGSLSVVIWTRDSAEHVAGALDTVLAQSKPPHEVIVVDDASADQTVAVMQRFQRGPSAIRLLRNREAAGRLVSLNRALSIASGEYLYVGDPRTRVSERFFEQSINLLSEYPRAGFCYSGTNEVGIAASRPEEPLDQRNEQQRYFPPSEFAEIVQGHEIKLDAVVWRRRILVDNYGFLRELRWLAEWFALLTIGFRHGACYNPETGVESPPRSSEPLPQAERDETLTHLLRLLRGDIYRDVLGLFIGTNLASRFSPDIERLVLGNAEHWEVESLLLIGQSLELAAAKNSVREMIERGKAAVAQGRLEAAQEIFTEAVRSFPRLHVARTLLARVAMARGDHVIAREALGEAVRLAPDDPEIHLQLGIASSRARDYDRALESFQTALSLDPTSLTVGLNLAATLELLGRQDEAARCYNERLPAYRDSVELLVAVGRLAVGLGQTAVARVAFRHALNADSACEEARVALVKLGAGERGVEDAERGLRPRKALVVEAGSGRTRTPAMPFHFVLAVWGQEYRDLFLDVTLPTQLGAGDLGGFSRRRGSMYKIYTTEADAQVMRRSRTYAKLARIIPTQIIIMDDLDVGDKYESMTVCHRHAVRAAGVAGAAMIVLSPDAIYSAGTFSRCARLADRGKRAVVLAGLRSVKETLVPELLSVAARGAGGGSLSGRDIVRLLLKHAHPYWLPKFWDAEEFTVHPSLLLWKVPGGGLLARAFHLHPIMINPVHRDVVPEGTIDGAYMNFACPDPDDIHVVEDSDEMAALEISALRTPSEPTRADGVKAFAVARWANDVATPLHRAFVCRRIFFHEAEIGKEWDDVVRASDEAIESILFFFRGLRVEPAAASM